MRRIRVEEIVSNIKEMCIEANHYLTEDMKLALKEAEGTERSTSCQAPREAQNSQSTLPGFSLHR